MTMTRSTYSQKLRDALDELRPAFGEVADGLKKLTQKRAEIAPSFMRAYTMWRRETRRSFVAFVQELDPSVPASKAGYQKHSSYHAAIYLRQLVEHPEESKRRGLTPLALSAVILKSVLPLFNQQEKEEVLLALTAACRWRDRDVAKLLAAVRRAKPVPLPKVPRLVEAAKATKAAVLAFERKRAAA